MRGALALRRAVPLLSRRVAGGCCNERSFATAAATEGTGTRRVGMVLFSGIVGTTAYLGRHAPQYLKLHAPHEHHCSAPAPLCSRSWQLYRYTWKLDLIEKRKVRLAQEPQDVFAVVADPKAGMAADDEFVPVACEGVFLHELQALVGPRSAPPGGVSVGPPGQPQPTGFEVVTPMECTGGERILVNRGWVPRDAVEQIGQPKGTVRVSGVLKDGDKPNKFANNDFAKKSLVWLDLPALAADVGSAPVLVAEAVDDGGSAGRAESARAARGAKPSWPLARPLETYAEFHVKPSTHLIYAATWCSLTAFGTFMTYKRFR